ncbi:MAG: polysaccharide biosynthesis/export family protein [Runella sp.]
MMSFRIACFWVLFWGVALGQNPKDTLSSSTILTRRLLTLGDTATYRIKAGDRLRIRNLNALETIYPQSAGLTVGNTSVSSQSIGTAAYETSVDSRGQIILPQVGRVKIAGLTKHEATTEIERRYRDLINEPIFEVTIINLHIKVLGSVARQGIITLENEYLTLGEVIALSGRIDFSSADKTIKIIRPRVGSQQEVEYDIRNLSDPAVSNIPVFEGDYVFVPPSKGSLRNIKNQRFANILQPIAITLNALAVLLGLYLAVRNSN